MQFMNLSLALPKERDAPAVLEWIRALDILIDSLGTFKFTSGEKAVSLGVLEARVRKELFGAKLALLAGWVPFDHLQDAKRSPPRPHRAKQAGG